MQNNQPKKTSIGGQALIEGIMMRGPETTAMAVRHTNGEIRSESWPTQGLKKPRLLKLPFLRGLFNMIDSMRFGYKCLMKSVELSGFAELEEQEKQKKKDKKAGSDLAEDMPADETVMEAVQENIVYEEQAVKTDEESTGPAADQPEREQTEPEKTIEEDKNIELSADSEQAKSRSADRTSPDSPWWMTLLMAFSMLLGVGLAVALFMWLPAQLYAWLKNAAPVLEETRFFWARGVFEGVIRMVLFVGYVSLVSLMKDIKRVFMYHGAEHKTIFCYEAGLPLTVENIREQSRFHPRCGTSFLVLVLLIGIFISMLIQVDNVALRVAIKLLTLPLVVGIGYELIKLAGRKDNAFTRTISKPGMWVQRITTKEPDDAMLEVAIAAMQPVIPADPDADRW